MGPEDGDKAGSTITRHPLTPSSDGPHTRALHSRCHMEKHRSCSCITGYHVLLYDLHGRGYSDAPQVTYDVSLYTTHLALLI